MLDGLCAHWLRPTLLALPGEWGPTAVLEATLLPSGADQRVPLLRHPEADAEVPGYLRTRGWVAWTAPVTPHAARELVRGRLAVIAKNPDDAADPSRGAPLPAAGLASAPDRALAAPDLTRPPSQRGPRPTGVQLGSVLDVIFAGAVGSPPLGATVERAPGAPVTPAPASARVTARLWAPTAHTVTLEVLDVLDLDRGLLAPEPLATHAAQREEATGVWTVPPEAGLAVGNVYRWVVTVYAPSTDRLEVNHVTDPYSFALTVGSGASVIVDLDDPALRPAQWETVPATRPKRQVDHMITELHVRDLSRDAVELDPAERGTFRAFTRDIPGTRHLRALADAGLTTVHLLPVYDIATVEEDRTAWAEAQHIADSAHLATLPPNSPEQQRLVRAANDRACTFNWGYDPLHVMAPEGSYAVAKDGGAHGAARCAEVREMVGALHEMGLAVVLDQVYNHTHACGQDATSVLCRVVPGYYSRLAPTGGVEESTCCPNVATERAMAQRWMVDSVVHWARQYRVDGFRFDLMGHHSRDNMLAVRAGLDALTLDTDGVDGAGILLYGEGWNFGEVADDERFVQARQGNLGGTGVATFSDRLRDAVVGGTPTDAAALPVPGLATGLVERAEREDVLDVLGEEVAARAVMDSSLALLRLGLAGTLREVEIPTTDGVRLGRAIDYSGQEAGYADDPAEVVSYIDAHDNETWYDYGVIKLPVDTPMADRVRVNTLGLASVAWGQSIGFWHAGTELLRSKSLDHDSYDSGDWFNRVDWSGRESTFGSGLPGAWRNEESWGLLRPLLARPELRPTPEAIAAARAAALDVLRVRREVPLLRLGSQRLVRACVAFPGAGGVDRDGGTGENGLVCVLVDGCAARSEDAGVVAAIDPAHSAALVALNFSRHARRVTVPTMRGRAMRIARPLIDGSDPVVRGTEWFAAPGVLQVPPLTAVVLVEPR